MPLKWLNLDVPVIETWGTWILKNLTCKPMFAVVKMWLSIHGVFPSPLSGVWTCQSYIRYLLCASAMVCVEARRQLAGVGSVSSVWFRDQTQVSFFGSRCYYLLSHLLLFFFFLRQSLVAKAALEESHSWGWPWTSAPPASTSWVLGLQVWAILPSMGLHSQGSGISE